MWVEAGILSWSPGFDSHPGKPHKKGPKSVPTMSYRDLQVIPSIFYLYKNGRADVCLSVGMWRAIGNPNPCTNRDEIEHAYPPPVQGRFWSRFDPPSPLGLGALKH